MGYTLDYFVGNLKCSICGVVSKADGSTSMTTKIRSQPELTYLGTGHALEIDPEVMEESGYWTIQIPRLSEEIRILHNWECPSCGFGFNWAEVAVSNSEIIKVIAVPQTLEVLTKAHFISDDCVSVAADIVGCSPINFTGADLVQRLQAYL
ncbi:hypothetical protein [Scytonema sp. NUACC26]|uniref:hypothetical protein n=1 Tax=Scytonema sp. NUACC26 TaxID=3140176 RepID=UPI0034DB9A3A